MMILTFHTGMDVISLKQSKDFYEKILNAKETLYSEELKCAIFEIAGQEINLFEKPTFNGYQLEWLHRFHLGFQVSSKENVDQAHHNCLRNSYRVIKEPYYRFDGDYALFIRDPNGMTIEVFHGTHHLLREQTTAGGQNDSRR